MSSTGLTRTASKSPAHDDPHRALNYGREKKPAQLFRLAGSIHLLQTWFVATPKVLHASMCCVKLISLENH